MQFLEKEVREYTQFTWNTILGLEVAQISNRFQMNSNDIVVGKVQIQGSWAGQVVLFFHLPLAKMAAQKMFNLKPEEVSSEEVRDAVGELVNMVGGNIKALVPQPAKLFLPVVCLDGRDFHFPETEPVCTEVFDSRGHQFMVQVLQTKENLSSTSTS